MFHGGSDIRSRIMQQARNVETLPVPDAVALTHSEKLQDLIRETIRQHGVISFSEFMNLALYAPGLGYYAAGSTKLGEAGDFTTAPEVSDLFSRCLANALQPIFQQQPGYTLMEAGAGRGTMARDLLSNLQEQDGLPERYSILELSADLRERQQQMLSGLPQQLTGKVQWLDALPGNFRGVIIANELFDAMPVTLFRIMEDGVHELLVETTEQGFQFVYRPSHDERLLQRIRDIENELGESLPAGYVSEVNFAAEDWIATVAENMAEGLLLFIDYGYPRHEYYHPQRSQGTLLCHYRHRAHDDVFYYPGLQDITAHIDFTAMADAALAVGMKVSGYTTQAHFLLGSGLMQMVETDNDPQQQLAAATAIRKLTLPQEMGEVFKVMMLSKGDVQIPHAFLLNDMRRYL